MKKKWIFLFFMFLILIPLTAQEQEKGTERTFETQLTDLITFDVSLKDLDRAAKSSRFSLDTTKFVMIHGIVNDILITEDESPDKFLAEIELISGEWLRKRSVRMYKCIVRIAGKEFSRRIQRRGNRNPENPITLNDQVIIIGKLQGTEKRKGQPIMVLDTEVLKTLY